MLQIIIDKLNFIDRKISGIRRVISMSKIKKINLIRKNWILNGKWLGEMGSNPHSNGEDFSRLEYEFFEIKMFNTRRKVEMRKNNGKI